MRVYNGVCMTSWTKDSSERRPRPVKPALKDEGKGWLKNEIDRDEKSSEGEREREKKGRKSERVGYSDIATTVTSIPE